jgi:hypothetical protein
MKKYLKTLKSQIIKEDAKMEQIKEEREDFFNSISNNEELEQSMP